MRICSIPGCGRKHNDHGLCFYHSYRKRKYGDENFKNERIAHNFIDYTGLKFGKLTVLNKLKKDKHGYWEWYCLCDCENSCIKTSQSFRKTKSCGCLVSEVTTKRNYIHGFTTGRSTTRFYRAWLCMKTRALNKNIKNAKNYSLRGITICERWKSFVNFYNDMFLYYEEHVKNYGEKETNLDRINNDGNYEPENCRWATHSQQSCNRRIWQHERNKLLNN